MLDVDDTALLTYNYEISEDFGFNPTTNAEFVLAQRFPAVFGMVDTVSWATQHGFTLFFITGRPDSPDGPGPACPNAAPPGRARESGDRVERAHDDARATAFPRRPRR